MCLGRVLAIKTRNLGEVARVLTGLNKTINHVCRFHIICPSQENRTKADVVDEIVIKSEDVLCTRLFRPMHCKENGLVNVCWVQIADDGEEDVVAIVRRRSAFG